LRHKGLNVVTIKHDVHGFEMDRPGKDSWRHKQASALTTVISSPYQVGMVIDVENDHQPHELLPLFTGMDIVLIEGFKRTNLPKIEVWHPQQFLSNTDRPFIVIPRRYLSLHPCH
jgi:molybdopterin-guanine dinucleotide biosynthesis protein B